MDLKEFKRNLDWAYEGYANYGPGHASTWLRILLKEMDAEMERGWAELEAGRMQRLRADMDCATRWAGHNVITVIG
jgi:hypothetical protein